MIGAFKILGDACVAHIIDGSGDYVLPVDVQRTNEPTSRLEELATTRIDIFPVTKQTFVEWRDQIARRTIAIGVGIRQQITEATEELVKYQQDQLMQLSDEIEVRLAGIQGYLDTEEIAASFQGINVDDERDAYFREMMKLYDTYDDQFLLAFETVLIV